MTEKVLEVRNLSKSFPGVKALEQVDFHLNKGEIRTLVGKNGAGKSTLIKSITGIYQQEEGQIFLNGEDVSHFSPEKMSHAGVEAIYQENDLIPYFTVGESIMLNSEPRTSSSLFINKKALYAASQRILTEELNSTIDPRTLIRELNVSQQQIVQIAKNLVKKPKVLIFDEPTAALSAKEIDNLFAIIRDLKTRGVSIIYISHRFDEVFALADSITVFRDGMKVADKDVRETTHKEIIEIMAGEDGVEISRERSHRKAFTEESVLTMADGGNSFISGISFELNRGEILGFFGGEGAGQQKLAQTLYGMLPLETGDLRVFGKPAVITSPSKAIELGLGYIPRNRKEEGVVMDFSIQENITLPILPQVSSHGFIQRSKEAGIALKQLQDLAIKAPGTFTNVRNLSGGNQQKVVLSRWIATAPKILILDYPTIGIDIKAKSEIYRILDRLTENGVSIILITPEFEEIQVLCDRVLVMRQGRIVKEFASHDISEKELLLHAIGVSDEY